MEDGTEKKVQDLNIGDMARHGGEVYALFIMSWDEPIYNYNGILVTGDHAVFEDDTWKRVSKSKKAFVSKAEATVVFNFSTRNHMIYSQGNKFSDYHEHDNANLTYEESLEKLNEAC